MTSQVISLPGPDDTLALAANLAISLQSGSVIALFGDLGAGKTTFVQGLGAALGVEGPIQSPTFTYLNIYAGPLPLYHFDLYRLKHPSDFFSMGFEEYFHGQGVVAIEWAERIQDYLPPNTLFLRFSHQEQSRVAQISSSSICVYGEKLINLRPLGE